MKEPEHKLNELTKRLFAEGYTRDNYPDYVSPYNWFYGGFTYTRDAQSKLVFSTPCGLLIKGYDFCGGESSFGGYTCSVSNHNPEVRCPYNKVDCELIEDKLKEWIRRGYRMIIVPCICHLTDREYDEEHSLKKVRDDIETARNQEFQLFKEKLKGHACRYQCIYNEYTGKWEQRYNPTNCIGNGCLHCDILGKDFSGKKGNVFYDVVTVSEIETGEGFLYEKKRVTHKIKGKRLFETPIAIELCQVIAKAFQNEVYDKEKGKYSKEIYFSEAHGKFFELKIENIRAEQRESRDLKQDLMDIRDGVMVVHESDLKAAKKKEKSEAAEKRKEQKKAKILRTVSSKGLKNMDGGEIARLEKAIDNELISSEEFKKAKKMSKLTQLSFFDSE